MTRKHFEAIAALLAATRPIALSDIGKAQLEQWKLMVEEFVKLGTSFNPRFKADKFREASNYVWNCKTSQ